MDDLLRCAVLEEALNSKRSVRERLMRELRRACGGPIDDTRLQTPIAGIADSAHTTVREPLAAFLLGALQRGGESAQHCSSAGSTAMSCESPLAR